MTLYKGMDGAELEVQYNLIQRRGADFPDLVKRWISRSENQRKHSGARIDLAYGTGEREKFDLFSCGNPDAPLLLYIHGGYWQRGDKNIYSFISEGLVQNGISVALINYDLTPAVRIGQIPGQIRKAIAFLWHNAKVTGFHRDKLYVMGHSAGGHLTAMMMATNWPHFDNRLPLDLVKGGIPISGIFELEPIIHTSLNEGPQMNLDEAVRESPLFMQPVTNAPQLVVAGGSESSEFPRQSDAYADRFRSAERAIERYDIPGCDHFDELDQFADENSVIFRKTMDLISS